MDVLNIFGNPSYCGYAITEDHLIYATLIIYYKLT